MSDMEFRQHRECKVIPISPERSAWFAWAQPGAGGVESGIDGPFACIACAIQYESLSFTRESRRYERQVGRSRSCSYGPDERNVLAEDQDLLEYSDVRFLLLVPATWDVCWFPREEIGWTEGEAAKVLEAKVESIRDRLAREQAAKATPPATDPKPETYPAGREE